MPLTDGRSASGPLDCQLSQTIEDGGHDEIDVLKSLFVPKYLMFRLNPSSRGQVSRAVFDERSRALDGCFQLELQAEDALSEGFALHLVPMFLEYGPERLDVVVQGGR